ncbi:ABC transporter ATP-binding protein [bacterium]|nr:ABC transporter ATP-binding protein [bacterium]
MSNYVIETKNLTKKYKNQIVLDSVSIKVEKGKIYGLLGKNGAGKTTTMSIILDLTRPSDGEVRLFGVDSKGNPQVYSRIGSIIETPGFYYNLTGFENLRILAELRGNYSEKNVKKALKIVSLDNENKKLVKHYSLGMKQRLGIAAAIMDFPELLILDEPINGLDPVGIQDMRKLFKNLVNEYDMTIFISSHILSEIEHIADIIGIIDKGKLVEEISMDNLHEKLSNYVDFEVSDYKLATEILMKHGFNENDFEIKNIDGYEFLRIFSNLDKRAEINEEFVKQGLKVYKQVLTGESL